MKLAALKISVLGMALGLAPCLASAGSALAFEARPSGYLGSTLYAGPNVVILENGRDQSSYTFSYTLAGCGRTYGQPPRGYGYGHRHRPPPHYRPYNGPRFGYQPYYKSYPVTPGYGRDN